LIRKESLSPSSPYLTVEHFFFWGVTGSDETRGEVPFTLMTLPLTMTGRDVALQVCGNLRRSAFWLPCQTKRQILIYYSLKFLMSVPGFKTLITQNINLISLQTKSNNFGYIFPVICSSPVS
jgi:hypothetical protein